MMLVIVVAAVAVAVLLLVTAVPSRERRDPRGSALRFSHQMGVLERAHHDSHEVAGTADPEGGRG